MPTAASLVAKVSAEGVEETQKKLLGVGQASDKTQEKFQALARTSEGVGSGMKTALLGVAVAAGAALIGIGAKAVTMAGDFQQATNQLVTSAGESRTNIDALRQGILKMSVDTATSWQELTAGMFNVDSAGYTLAKGGLLVLKAAAEGARAEGADLASTTDVLTTAMHNFHLPASQSVNVMNSLITTVANGKMHMNDLTGALRNVLPVASAFHIKLSDVEGALSTMAMSGDKGTAAGTHLAMMFKMLSSPTGAAAKEMRSMGIDSIKLAQTMQTSLPDALKMIQDAVAKHFVPGSVEYNRAIQAILGGSKSGIAGLEIMGDSFKNLEANTKAAALALEKGGTDVENWDTIQGNFNFKLEAANDAIQSLLISLGSKLLPIASQLTGLFAKLVGWLADWIGHSALLDSISRGLSKTLTAIGDAVNWVAGQFQEWWNELSSDPAWKLFVSEIQDGWNTIMGLFKGFGDWIASQWPGIMDTAKTIWNKTVGVLYTVFQSVVQEIQKFSGQWNDTWKAIQSNPTVQAVEQSVTDTFNTIKKAIGKAITWIHDHWDDVMSYLKSRVQDVEKAVKPVFEQIGKHAKTAIDAIQTASSPVLNWLALNWAKIPSMIITTWQAVQNDPHFKAVVQMLKDLGNWLLLTFQPDWDNLVTTLQKKVIPSFKDLQKALVPLEPFFLGFAAIVGILVAGALGRVVGTIAGLLEALSNFLYGLETFIGGVAEFFTGIVQLVSGFLQLVGDLFSLNTGKIGKDWDMMWQGFVNISKGFGDICWGLFVATFGAIFGFLKGFVEGVIGWFKFLYNVLVGHSIVPDLVNSIVAWFAKLPGRALDAISGLAGRLGGVFGGIANQALSWGANIANNVAQGISNGIGNAISAAQNLAASIAAYLPHSPAKEGPLKRLNEFGPALVKGFSKGIIDSTPTLRAAVTHMIQPTVPGSPQFTSSMALAGGGSIHVHVHNAPPDFYVDSYRLAKAIMPAHVELIRSHSNSHGH